MSSAAPINANEAIPVLRTRSRSSTTSASSIVGPIINEVNSVLKKKRRSSSNPYSPRLLKLEEKIASTESLDWDTFEKNPTFETHKGPNLGITGTVILAENRVNYADIPENPASITDIVGQSRKKQFQSETTDGLLDEDEVFSTPQSTPVKATGPTGLSKKGFAIDKGLSPILKRGYERSLEKALLRAGENLCPNFRENEDDIQICGLDAAVESGARTVEGQNNGGKFDDVFGINAIEQPSVVVNTGDIYCVSNLSAYAGNMDNATKIKYQMDIDRATNIADNEMADLDFAEFPDEFVVAKLREADAAKQLLLEAMTQLKFNDKQNYDANFSGEAIRVKGDLTHKIRDGHKYLKQKADAKDAADTAARADAANTAGAIARIKDARVKRLKDVYDAKTEGILNSLREVEEDDASLDGEVEALSEKLARYSKDADDHVKDIQSLVSDAIAAAMEPEIISLEGQITRIKTMKSVATNAIIELREHNGIVGKSSLNNHRLTDLKPPTFNGVQTGANLDFFTFKSEFIEYADSKNLSNEQRCTILKKTCLQGAAKTLVLHDTRLEVIWINLKGAYGTVSLLISKQLQVIRKYGKCEGTAEQKREWAIDMHAKLTRLLNIAVEHKKEDDIFHSTVVGEVRKLLPWKVQEEFVKLVSSHEDETHDEVTRQELFNMFLAYLKKFVSDETFRLRFDEMCDGETKTSSKHTKQPEQNKYGNRPSRKTNAGFQNNPQTMQGFHHKLCRASTRMDNSK